MADNPREIAEYQSDHDLLIRLDQKVSDIGRKLDDTTDKYVTQSEFWPVKVLVYGCVALMLTAIISALLFLVIKQ